MIKELLQPTCHDVVPVHKTGISVFQLVIVLVLTTTAKQSLTGNFEVDKNDQISPNVS